MLELGLELVFPLLLLLLAYAVGSLLERRHYRNIRMRELRWRRLPAVTFRSLPGSWRVHDCGLVACGTVVSLDHFKRFLAGLRQLFGGRVRAYESLLDRGRREAVLRLKEEAHRRGFQAVVNVRLETSRLASARGNGKGTAGVEVLAFGTGLALGGRSA